MKVVQQGKRWWAGLRGQCHNCTTVVEFEGHPDEMLVLETGDFKDPAIYQWECPECDTGNTTTLDRMRSEQPMIARLLDSNKAID